MPGESDDPQWPKHCVVMPGEEHFPEGGLPAAVEQMTEYVREINARDHGTLGPVYVIVDGYVDDAPVLADTIKQLLQIGGVAGVHLDSDSLHDDRLILAGQAMSHTVAWQPSGMLNFKDIDWPSEGEITYAGGTKRRTMSSAEIRAKHPWADNKRGWRASLKGKGRP